MRKMKVHKYGMTKDMRSLIRLIENQLPQPALTDAYEIISNYVTHGEVRPEHQAAIYKDFRELMNILPRPSESFEVYRFLRLTDQQMRAIKTGLTLEMREFSSWTKSLDAAKTIAMKKQGNGHPIIVKARFPAREIVVDVSDFYEENDFTARDYSEYHKYVLPEQEVVIYHHGPIRLTPQNTLPLEKPQEGLRPMIGDMFYWGPDGEDGFEIEDVDYDQPYAGRGIFYVTPEGHQPEPCRNIGPGEWEFIDIEQ